MNPEEIRKEIARFDTIIVPIHTVSKGDAIVFSEESAMYVFESRPFTPSNPLHDALLGPRWFILGIRFPSIDPSDMETMVLRPDFPVAASMLPVMIDREV